MEMCIIYKILYTILLLYTLTVLSCSIFNSAVKKKCFQFRHCQVNHGLLCHKMTRPWLKKERQANAVPPDYSSHAFTSEYAGLNSAGGKKKTPSPDGLLFTSACTLVLLCSVAH